MFYFVGIISGIGDFSYFYQVVLKFFQVKPKVQDISKLHKSPTRKGESSYR